jgi:hypothetical protein
VVHFKPELVAHFGPEIVAQFNRNLHVSVKVRDSVIVAYPGGVNYQDSTYCIEIANGYFNGNCTFWFGTNAVLLNVLKKDWSEFLQNVLHSDTLFTSETWKSYVLDFDHVCEFWVSSRPLIDFDNLSLDSIILNGDMDLYFDRIY